MVVTILTLCIWLGLVFVAIVGCFQLAKFLAGANAARTGNWYVALTVVACLVALWLAVVPGRLDGIFSSFILVIVLLTLLPVVAIVGPLMIASAVKRGSIGQRLSDRGFSRSKLAVWALVLISTYMALHMAVPHRLGFAASRRAFAALVPKAPSERAPPPGGRVGVYAVDAYAVDSRGGVFFRTSSHSQMIDRVSYGFAYKPNKQGTPFGNAHYSTWPLGDGWFGFTANNDW